MRKLVYYSSILLTLLQNQSIALVLEGGMVHSFGGTSFIYSGFYMDGLKPYAIIEAYSEDIWRYGVGDTMWLDSAALIVKNIDTQKNSAEIDLVPDIVGRKRDSTLIGAWGSGVLFRRNAQAIGLSITGANKTSVIGLINCKKKGSDFN